MKNTNRVGAVCVTWALSAGSALATCPIFSAYYVPGSTFGAAAAAATGCFQPVVGGAGSLSAADSRLYTSASADLRTGVLTTFAGASGQYPSAALWDTLTFSGLPAGGSTLTTSLSLTGGLTGSASAYIQLSAGASPDAGNTTTTALTKDYFPASVSHDFLAQNGVPYLLFAGMSGSSNSGTIDLLDPPTYSIGLPAGVTFTSASGVFTNVGAVPEPATALLWALAGLGLLTRRLRRS